MQSNQVTNSSSRGIFTSLAWERIHRARKVLAPIFCAVLDAGTRRPLFSMLYTVGSFVFDYQENLYFIGQQWYNMTWLLATADAIKDITNK